jgi:hypothetical protein
MKNITFSAQEELIQNARNIASQKNVTLNDMFRAWLKSLSDSSLHSNQSESLHHLWEKTSYFKVQRKLSREEMNER